MMIHRSARPSVNPWRRPYIVSDGDNLLSAVELSPLNIDTVLPSRHPQLLHRQHRPILATALPTTTIPGSLYTNGPAAPLVLASRLAGLLTGDGEAGRGAEVTHRVVGVAVTGAHAAVLVCIGGEVGDEFLRREREEAREARVRLWWRGEAGAGHVIVRHRIRDLGGGWVSLRVWTLSEGVGEAGESHRARA